MSGSPDALGDGAEFVVDVLGSASGYPSATRDTTSLLVGVRDDWTLIDCPGSVVHKLAQRGLQPDDVTRVVLTHDHVDHVYGLPHFLQSLAIAGQRAAVVVHAPRQTLETVEDMVATHRLDGDGYPPINAIEIDMTPGTTVAEFAGARMTASPAAHGRDTVALRVETPAGSFCHSADTRASKSVAQLARNADVLFHDCGGPETLRQQFEANHASATDAGRVAQDAEVGELVLIHLGVNDATEIQACVDEARQQFSGPVTAASDGVQWLVGGAR